MSMTSKQRVVLMLPVLVGAGWLAVFGDKTPSGERAVVAPVVNVTRTTSAVDVPPDNFAITGEMNGSKLQRVRDRLNLADLENGPQVDLFAGQGAAQVSVPQTASSAPSLDVRAQPFVLIGRMFDHDHWRAFLEHEGTTYVVQARDVIEGFRIDALTGQEIRLTQLADKSKFVIQIDGEKKDLAHD